MTPIFEWLRNWDGDLIGCPSQRYRPFRIQRVGVLVIDAQAYLRWRHEDPWTAAVIPSHLEEYRFWFRCAHRMPQFRHDEYLLAQKWFAKWVEEHKKEVIRGIADSMVEKATDFRKRTEKLLRMRVWRSN